MQAKVLREILLDLEKELYRLGYTEAPLKYYRNYWLKLLQFADERNEMYFTEQLGINRYIPAKLIMKDYVQYI